MLVKLSFFKSKSAYLRALNSCPLTSMLLWLMRLLLHLINQGIFRLFISIFSDLADTASPYFTRRARVLKVVADVKCCLLMLDIGCMDLVLEMFRVFFSAVRLGLELVYLLIEFLFIMCQYGRVSVLKMYHNFVRVVASWGLNYELFLLHIFPMRSISD